MNQKYLPYAFLSLLFTLFLTLPSACIDDPEVEPGIQNARTPQMGETVTINAPPGTTVIYQDSESVRNYPAYPVYPRRVYRYR